MEASKQRLEEALQQVCDASLFFCMGVELEFYAKKSSFEALQKCINGYCQKQKIPSVTLLQEEGEGQFELVFLPSKDLLCYADAVANLRQGLLEYASQTGEPVDFSAKPDSKQAGSALHVHISLYDQAGKNLYATKPESGKESNYLIWSIAGLLEDMIRSMPVFASNEKDYLRYQYPDRNSPATVSWGGDNRTVALRIPPVGEDQQQRRIEHRVPSPSADIYLVFTELVNSIYKGIIQERKPISEKIYGNAWDAQYGLMPLPTCLS